jgi:hypothetical protein
MLSYILKQKPLEFFLKGIFLLSWGEVYLKTKLFTDIGRHVTQMYIHTVAKRSYYDSECNKILPHCLDSRPNRSTTASVFRQSLQLPSSWWIWKWKLHVCWNVGQLSTHLMWLISEHWSCTLKHCGSFHYSYECSHNCFKKCFATFKPAGYWNSIWYYLVHHVV